MIENWAIIIPRGVPEIPDELYCELAERWPQYVEKDRIFFRRITPGEYDEVVDFCSRIGFVFPPKGSDYSAKLIISKRIEYSQPELAEAQYLKIGMSTKIATVSRHDDTLLTREEYDGKDLDIGSGGYGRLLFRNSAKIAFEKQGFLGLDFEECFFERIPSEEAIWLVTPTITLPHMSGLGVTSKREIIPGGGYTSADEGFFIYDPFIHRKRIRYDKGKLPEFDIARTFETFGRSRRARPSFICSNRFYLFCRKFRTDIEWDIVLLNDEADCD